MPKIKCSYSIPVLVLKEGNCFVAYSPAIDVSTVGDTFEEAKTRFTEAANLFFEEIIEKGKVNEALIELGWQTKNDQLIPPSIISHQAETFSFNNFLQ